MNLDQLGQSFEANKVPVLVTAAVGVVGFALLQKRKAAAPAAAPAQGVATTGGVYSAGGQVAGATGAAAYDSTSSDVYGLVQPQLESLGGQLSSLNAKLNAVPVSAAPTGPIAGRLTAPTGSGQYVRYGTTIDELESDNSLYALTLPEWQALGSPSNWSQLGTQAQQPGTAYTRAGNLAARVAAGQQPPTTTTPATS